MSAELPRNIADMRDRAHEMGLRIAATSHMDPAREDMKRQEDELIRVFLQALDAHNASKPKPAPKPEPKRETLAEEFKRDPVAAACFATRVIWAPPLFALGIAAIAFVILCVLFGLAVPVPMDSM